MYLLFQNLTKRIKIIRQILLTILRNNYGLIPKVACLQIYIHSHYHIYIYTSIRVYINKNYKTIN
jgi:hypothetical protein